MRKVLLYMITTLDGFISGSNGEFNDYEPSAEEMAFANEFFGAADGILFGRVVYEAFIPFWDTLDPTDPAFSEGDVQFSTLFRTKPRVVFSRTLKTVDDKATLIKDNIPTEVLKLKGQAGGNLILLCGPELLATFVEHELVDEFWTLVSPMVLGKGKALFGEIAGKLDLTLIATKVFQSGGVLHRYQPSYRKAQR